MEKANAFMAGVGAVIGFVSGALGWVAWLILAWVAAFNVDIITGCLAAKRNGEWKSQVMRDGLYHKGGSLAMLIGAGLFDAVIGATLEALPLKLPFDYGVLMLPLLCLWYIVMEIGSIAENARRMGAEVPEWFSHRVSSVQSAVDTAAGGVSDTTGHGDTAGTQKPTGREPETDVTTTQPTEEDGEDGDDDDDG